MSTSIPERIGQMVLRVERNMDSGTVLFRYDNEKELLKVLWRPHNNIKEFLFVEIDLDHVTQKGMSNDQLLAWIVNKLNEKNTELMNRKWLAKRNSK